MSKHTTFRELISHLKELGARIDETEVKGELIYTINYDSLTPDMRKQLEQYTLIDKKK